MFPKRIVCAVLAMACFAALCVGAAALEVDCDTTYCFSAEDFSPEEPLVGICITELPQPETGTVMLGSRVLRPGDILTADQLAQLTFSPLQTANDRQALVTYLPIYENRVAPAATMTISVRGKTNQAPIAQDFALETYRNLPNKAALKVSDPEGQALVFTVTRQPKRGSVTIEEDGTFTYTPKKNKVGVDSFVFTATDPAGNVSREATVTIRILKPTDASQYTDTLNSDCRFEAEWLKNTGLFVGEEVGGQLCFQENKSVSRGEFLTMAIKSLGIPVDEKATFTGYADQLPNWLKPYLAAALRSGITAGLPLAEGGNFGWDSPIRTEEAALILQNAMDLQFTDEISGEDLPTWAVTAVSAMSANGIAVTPGQVLTRGQAAEMLYQASALADQAPGLQMYR